MSTTADKTLNALAHKKTSSLNEEERRALLVKQLDKQKRHALTDFNMGKIKDWKEFVLLSGMPAPVDLAAMELSYGAIKAVFDRQIEAIKSGAALLEPPKPAAGKIEDDPSKPPEKIEDEFSLINCLRNNDKVIYNKHQEKATGDLLRGFIKYDYHGQALNSRVGSGKTIILGALIKELWERQWKPIMESVSQYAILFVTRATVVEQTERELKRKFGLRIGHQIAVTNIDQLRSKWGEKFIKEEIIIQDGKEYSDYKWYPFLSPTLIILDEAQAVKNIDSTQSRIFQKFNEMPDGYLLCSSATLFTRVIESKVMAVSTRLEW